MKHAQVSGFQSEEDHADDETRFKAIGKARDNRHVFVVFTLRRDRVTMLIRPISARYMHQKEVTVYEKENPDIQE
jgi:uncharacterized protein